MLRRLLNQASRISGSQFGRRDYTPYTSKVLSGDVVENLLAPWNKEKLTEERRTQLIKEEEARIENAKKQQSASIENKESKNAVSEQSKFSEENSRRVTMQEAAIQEKAKSFTQQENAKKDAKKTADNEVIAACR